MSEPRSWNETANIVEKAKKEVGTSISTAKDEIISTVKKAAESGSSASGVQTFTADGTFIVPAGVHKIFVTAFAGGGGGNAEGGQGGEYVVRRMFAVEPLSQLEITIGTGGKGWTNAGQSAGYGGATVISGLITLAGGAPGGSTRVRALKAAAGGASGGSAYSGSDGENSEFSLGGRGGQGSSSGDGKPGGGGGGAGYECGGDGGEGDYSPGNGKDGGIGAGGGGQGRRNDNRGYAEKAGNGGDGIVIIEW